MLSGLQQLSPMPCHSTTGVGSDDGDAERHYGDVALSIMQMMVMVMSYDASYRDDDGADILRQRERARVIRALTWRELGLVGI